MKKSETVFILSLLIPLIPMAIAKQWWLFSVFTIFYAVFGVVEFVAVLKTDKTVSQHFWEFSKKNKTKAIIILATMCIMWASLIWHLAEKMM